MKASASIFFALVFAVQSADAQVLLAKVPAAPPATRIFPSQKADPTSFTVHQREYREVYEYIVQHHPDRAALARLKVFDGAIASEAERDTRIQELIAALGDRWTKYYTPSQIAGYDALRARGAVGLGFSVLRQDKGTYIVGWIMLMSNAEQAGLRKGDEVISVDGKTLKELSPDATATLLADWSAGETAEVVARHGEQEKVYKIDAVTPEAKLVSGAIVDGRIAYIRVRDFSDFNLLPSFARLAPALKRQAGGKIEGIILDLRGNTGGYMQVAYEFATAFMHEGAIAHTTYRSGRLMQRSVYEAEPFLPDFLEATDENKALIAMLQTAPLVVLANGSTMSAAEMLTSALKDSGRATILGERTGGKGVSFNTITLSTGARLQLVSGTFAGPTGYEHHNKGIAPHHVVSQPRGRAGDVQLQKAVASLKAQPTAAPPVSVESAPGSPWSWKLPLSLLLLVAIGTIAVTVLVMRRVRPISERSKFRNRTTKSPEDAFEPQLADLAFDGSSGEGEPVDWAIVLKGGVTASSEDGGAFVPAIEAGDDCEMPVAEGTDCQSFLVSADSFYIGAACNMCGHNAVAGDILTERVDRSGCTLQCSRCGALTA